MGPEYVGALAEVIGAAAVVVSLLYVARQVRQSGQHARLMTVQSVAAQFNSHFDLTAASPATAMIWSKGLLEGIAALEEAEALQFGQLLGRSLKNYEELYRYRLEGLIDEDRLIGLEYAYLSVLAAPGFQDFWKLYGSFFAEDFRRYVDSKVTEARRLIDLSALRTAVTGDTTTLGAS